MMKKSLFAFLFILIPLTGFSQDLSVATQKADSIVQEFFISNNFPGMSVSVFKGNEMVWSKGYGFADVENQIPVDPSVTKFRIGSVSKTLTAAGLGVLIQEDKVDPDAEIQKYVPQFPEKNYPITVKQVAGHIAGIRHYRGSEFMSKKLYETVNEGLTIFMNDTLLFEPGTQYSYSSYGWNLISAVIEGASGEEFLPFMKEEVFDPLGMNNTVPEWSNQEIPDLTKFYARSGDSNEEAEFVDNSYKWAGGGFVGTTEDLIMFGKAFLDHDYLNEETQAQLMTPQTLENGESTNYGMGWSVLTDDAGRIWTGHSGGSVGGRTMFLINKENRMVIAYTVNHSSASFGDLHFQIADVFLDE